MGKPAKIILGIDPGTLIMGYGIVQVGSEGPVMRAMDVLRLSPRSDNYSRLELIYRKVEELIRLFQPDCFAIEAPFFGKNVQSMLKLGRAQGVAIAAAINAGLEVNEYSPRKVKQSVTGNGNAGKEQVWKMLQQILALQQTDLNCFDASDALAVAVCHHFQDKPLPAKANTRISDWKSFISLNPERVKKRV